MALAKRMQCVADVLDEISKREAFQILQKKWSSPIVRQVALDRIKQSSSELTAIIGTLDPPPSHSPALAPVLDAYADFTLTYLEQVVANARSADVRLAQFQGFRDLRTEHLAELQTVEKAKDAGEAAKIAASLIDKMNTAVKALRGIAENPLKYMPALQFWNKSVAYLAKMKYGKSLSKLSIFEGSDIMEDIRNGWLFDDANLYKPFPTLAQVQVDKLRLAIQLTADDLSKAAKFLGYAGTLLAVTVIVLNTLSDQKHWAEAFAKATFATGVAFGLSTVITSASVGSVVASIGSAFGIAAASTVELPPVALFLAATGLVLMIGIAVGELFSFLLDSLFGGDIPASMRLEMVSPMASSMRSQITSPMSTSMS